MKNHIDGKVIIVTGAGGGFGRLTAQKAAAMGGKIVCAGRTEANTVETVNLIRSAGGEAIAAITDVSSKEQVDAMAQAAIAHFDRIDVLVNNAGIMPLSFFSDHKAAWKAWDACIDINLKGTIYGISAVYDQMIAQGEGHIVNISSIYANTPVVGGSVYQATKIAVQYIADILRQEARGKIKVSVVKPTGIPATGLMSTVVNRDAQVGILGQNAPELGHVLKERRSQPEMSDPESIRYFSMDPQILADNIIYVINQPMGVNISDITVRTSNELFVV